MKRKSRIFAVTAALAMAGVLRAEPETELKKAATQARAAVEHVREGRAERRKELERLKKDLRYVSEELDREVIDEELNRGLSAYSTGGLARLDALARRGELDPELQKVLEKLRGIYRELPSKEYAKDYAPSLLRAVSDELRSDAEEAKDKDALLKRLVDNLVLPSRIQTSADVGASGFFPEDLTVEKFKELGAIKIFLAKHRLERPSSLVKTTAKDLVADKHHVQIGVEIEGTVTSVYNAIDRDYTFNIGELHIELTPEWRLRHPKLPQPKTGEKVRLRGWTYYDKFHETELEYDPDDPVLGAQRTTLWEIHPVMDIDVLP